MTQIRWVRAVLAAVLILTALGAAPERSAAGEMEWKFRSQGQDDISVELYSQDRGKTWGAFRLAPGASERMQIQCQDGERICFGAWDKKDTSRYWGAGRDGIEACGNCCAVCGSKGLGTQVLRP